MFGQIWRTSLNLHPKLFYGSIGYSTVLKYNGAGLISSVSLPTQFKSFNIVILMFYF